MSIRQLARTALCALALASVAVTAAAEEELTRLPLSPEIGASDQWMGIYIQGRKCGYAHRVIERGEGDAPWRLTFAVRMDLSSLGSETTMEMTQRLEFDAAEPYALRGGGEDQSIGGQKQVVQLERAEAGFVATITAADSTRNMTFDAIDYTLPDALAIECLALSKPAIGSAIRVRTFDISDLTSDVDLLTVTGEETSVAGGVPVRFLVIDLLEGAEQMKGLARVDAAGNVVTATVGGGFAEVRLETEEIAKQIEVSSDLFVLGMVKIDKPLGDSVSVRELVLEVSGEGAGELPSGPRQTVSQDEGGPVILSIGKAHGKPEKATPEDIEKALAETVEYPTKHPTVVALAAKAVGDATTDREKVNRLVTFVSDYIEDALSADSPTVEYILAKKKGDCTEHALFFTTLARAAGIPSREVGGLLYVGDEMQAFGGHAWNQVVLDGRWVPVDAAWDQTEIDATHIEFGTGDRSGSVFMAVFGKLSLKLRSVKRAE